MRVVAVTVRASKPTTAFGQIARPPLQSGVDELLLRAGIPGDIPTTAIVTKADLVLHHRSALTGTRNVSARRHADNFGVSRVTWNRRPTPTGATATTTVPAGPADSEIRIDVSAHAQEFIAGNATNYGWRITTDDATMFRLHGVTAAQYQPYLDLEYVEPGEPPTDLSPDGGAVSVSHPTLTFTAVGEVQAIRVVIDDGGTAPYLWDSGEVPATGGLLDLSTSTYTGLSEGVTRLWAAEVKTALGWSGLSEWATVTRTAKPVVTVTAPDATTGDKSPPIAWTAPGQAMWQALLLNAAGKVVADSSRQAGTDTVWVPPKGLKKVGDTGRAVVRVWDNVDRIAEGGRPTHSQSSVDFTVVAAGAAPGVDGLIATQTDASPVVRLSWSGPVTDLKQIVRDGDLVDVVDGTTAIGTWDDYTAIPNRQHVYRVFPLTSTGVLSANGPTASVTPTCGGEWLIDPDDGAAVMVVPDGGGTSTMPEQTVVHEIMGAPPVRRRSGVLPPRGTLSGQLHDVWEFSAPDMVETLYAWKKARLGHVYRYVVGNWNVPVTLGDIEVGHTQLSTESGRVHSVSLTWWQENSELPWDA